MTKQSANSIPRIRPREQRVLEHTARYRLTTIDTLRRAVLPVLSRGAVAKFAARLSQRKLLAKYPLVHPLRYFVLGSKGALALGLRPQRGEPLGPQSLPIEYGILVHAVLGKRPRRRLTTGEVKTLCPWLPERLAAAPHCLDVEADVLELVRVDLGGPAQHLARKTMRDLLLRRRHREFREQLGAGRFRLVIITPTREKARAIRASLQGRELPAELQFHFAVVPQLLSLTTRQHDA